MTYGPLPDHGFENVKLVYHTTETRGQPGYGGGSTAPHYQYNPTSRIWTMFAEYEDGRVGTMKGHGTNHANDSAFQVEILGYSDGRHSPWVGDFTDQNYQDLADFYRWAMHRYPIGRAVTPTPAGGWKYGVSAPTRGTKDAYNALSGLTAHGWVYGNSHWDAGVLDLQRIHDLAIGEPMFTHYQIDEEYGEWEDIVWLLFMLEGGTVNPNRNSSQVRDELPYKTSVRRVQDEDFDLIAEYTEMTPETRRDMDDLGLYRWGLEIASLKQQAFKG
jgi:hypothetical protein